MAWDSRLDQRGATLIPATVQPGESYWRLVDAQWLDPQQAQAAGPDHHILISPADLFCRVWWPSGETFVTKDYPMSSAGTPYNIRPATDIPADAVHGLGLGTIEQPFHTIHTGYRFAWELATAGHVIALPTLPTSPSTGAATASGYPQPQPNTGVGLHSPADSGMVPPDIVAHAKTLQRYGITWVKILATDTRHVARCIAYREHNIMPIVRFYSHEPHPDYIPDASLVRAYVQAGAAYVEAGNEPNLQLEWRSGHPIDADAAAVQYLRGAEIVLAAGGVPLIFALSPGGNYLHLNFLRDFLEACLRHDGLAILQRSAQAIHNRPLHSSEIGESPSPSRHTFRDYKLQAAIVQERVGRILPMLGTEAGYSILPNFNGGDNVLWAARNREILERANPAHPQAWPDYMLCQCYWLETAGGQWAGDEAFRGWMPDSPTAVGAMLLDLRPSWNRNKETALPAGPPPGTPVEPAPPQPAGYPIGFDHYEAAFRDAGNEFGIDWRILAAIARKESNFNPQAVGAMGERGMLQFMPSTWGDAAILANVPTEHAEAHNPQSAIRAAAAYLHWLDAYLDARGKPDDTWMLAAYNWGIGNVQNAAGWDIVPAVVQGYVADVLRYRDEFVTDTPLPTPVGDRRIVWPMDGRITVGFGEAGVWARHMGTDVSGVTGTPVKAMAAGVVAYVDVDKDYGLYARIWHPQFSFHTHYAHLSAQHVQAGQTVAPGQVIGLCGATGKADGSHLHLEVRIGTGLHTYADIPNGYGKGRVDPITVFHLIRAMEG